MIVHVLCPSRSSFFFFFFLFPTSYSTLEEIVLKTLACGAAELDLLALYYYAAPMGAVIRELAKKARRLF